MDFISLTKESETEGRRHVSVFCLTSEQDKEKYEFLLNDEDSDIISESTPQMDKSGRVMVTVH